jgi:hypothetical protein
VPESYPIWRFLAGFVTESEARAYVTSQGIQLTPEEDERYRAEVSKALAFVRAIPTRDGSSPKVLPLPATARGRVNALEAEPTFKELVQGGVSSEWAMVEASKLRCFQQNINLEYVDQLQPRLPRADDTEALLAFCQPLVSERKKVPIPIQFNPASNTYTIVTENLDFRILGNINGQTNDANGIERTFVGFMFGFGLPQIVVAEYKGRYILRNGYHRAFSLLKAGHKELPCLIVHTENYQGTGGSAPGFLPPDLVMSDRAPELGDYLTDAAIDIPRRRLRVIVSIHGEAQVIGA